MTRSASLSQKFATEIVLSFDDSIKLVTKFGYQSIEYGSCAAVLRRKSKSGKSRKALPTPPVCQKPIQSSSYKK